MNKHNCKVDTIKNLCNTTLSDDDKLYYIQSYLLGWIDEREMRRLIVTYGKFTIKGESK